MRRTLITASALAVGLLLAACGGGSGGSTSNSGSTGSEAPAPAASTAASASATAPMGYEAFIVGGKITTAKICDTYTGILTKFISTASAQLKSGNKYVNDPYKASSYINNVAWVDTDSEERLAGLLDKAATSALNVVTDGQAGQVPDLEPYLADSLDACGLTTQATTARSKASAVNTLAKDLSAEADNKPWYPRGYDEWSDGVAFKFNRSATNSGYLWGWAYNVVTRDGCPNGLYVEVNFVNSNGTVLDWGNDRISSLAPGQRALMEFRVGTDSGGVDTFETTEVSCR